MKQTAGIATLSKDRFSPAAGQLGIVMRENALRRLDHRHLRTELAVGSAEFQPDVAAANHDEPLRDISERERLGGRYDRPAEWQPGQRHAFRASGDDDVLGRDFLAAHVRIDHTRLAVAQDADAVDDLDAGAAQEAIHAAAQPRDDPILPRHRRLQIDAGLASANAER